MLSERIIIRSHVEAYATELRRCDQLAKVLIRRGHRPDITYPSEKTPRNQKALVSSASTVYQKTQGYHIGEH